MSRIGSKPIPIPSGVKVKIDGSTVQVEGPKGKLATALPEGIEVEEKDGQLNALMKAEGVQAKAFWGLARSLVANAVHGVSQGFAKELDIVGIGYRAQLEGRKVSFAPRLLASHRVPHPRGHRHRDRQEHPHHRLRRRQAARRSDGSQHPLPEEAGSLQAEGHPLHG